MGIQTTFLGTILAVALALPAAAADPKGVPEKKRTKAGLYLTAIEAAEMLTDEDVLFLDVRSQPEVTFVGMPARVNVHIPFMVMSEPLRYDADKQSYLMEQNAGFEFDFLDFAEAEGLIGDAPIVVMCRSGSRSAKAANVLYDLGFTQAYTVIDGFEGDKASDGPERGHRVINGWRNAGLEWDYAIAPQQAYPGDRM